MRIGWSHFYLCWSQRTNPRLCVKPCLPPATLTCGAIQPASRSEEATFEFVKKNKKQKTTKAPNQTNTARHGRCFLQPAPSTIWCGGLGKLGHRWHAWYQPCFLNTPFLSVNDNAQTHGAAGSREAPATRFSWPGAPGPASSLQMAAIRILQDLGCGCWHSG